MVALGLVVVVVLVLLLLVLLLLLLLAVSLVVVVVVGGGWLVAALGARRAPPRQLRVRTLPALSLHPCPPAAGGGLDVRQAPSGGNTMCFRKVLTPLWCTASGAFVSSFSSHR